MQGFRGILITSYCIGCYILKNSYHLKYVQLQNLTSLGIGLKQ